MKQKLLHIAAKLTLGNHLAMALTLLHLILQALENKEVKDISRFVFTRLPGGWREPQGPATEAEFVDMIQAGQLFLGKLKAVLD